MKLETYLAIRALMSADGTMHPRDRSAILAAVRNHGQQPNEPKVVPLPKVISRAQAAEMLNCTTRTVDNLGEEGLLPAIRIPGRSRAHGVLLADVIELIEQSRQSGTKGAKLPDTDSIQQQQTAIPEDELVILAQKVAYGAATPVEKGQFKGIVKNL